MKNSRPTKSSSLSLLLWTTTISISLLFNPLAANAQVTGSTPTNPLDPEVNSRNSALTQGVTYFDAYYRRATATNYTYKRVIKYEGPIRNANQLEVYMSGIPNVTINPVQTGIHYCSLNDFYRTGEHARKVEWILSTNKTCSQGEFNGRETLYYKNGKPKQEATYYKGKLHGRLITYDEAGKQVNREDYDHGVLIEENRLIVGTWKYAGHFTVMQDYIGVKVPRVISVSSTATFSQNGVVEYETLSGYDMSRINANWKYIPKDASSGVLEEYQGGNLTGRGTVKWLSRDQFEYTATFSTNSDMIGKQFVWKRQ